MLRLIGATALNFIVGVSATYKICLLDPKNENKLYFSESEFVINGSVGLVNKDYSPASPSTTFGLNYILSTDLAEELYCFAHSKQQGYPPGCDYTMIPPYPVPLLSLYAPAKMNQYGDRRGPQVRVCPPAPHAGRGGFQFMPGFSKLKWLQNFLPPQGLHYLIGLLNPETLAITDRGDWARFAASCCVIPRDVFTDLRYFTENFPPRVLPATSQRPFVMVTWSQFYDCNLTGVAALFHAVLAIPDISKQPLLRTLEKYIKPQYLKEYGNLARAHFPEYGYGRSGTLQTTGA